MMVSEVPASEYQLRGYCDRGITVAGMVVIALAAGEIVVSHIAIKYAAVGTACTHPIDKPVSFAVLFRKRAVLLQTLLLMVSLVSARCQRLAIQAMALSDE